MPTQVGLADEDTLGQVNSRRLVVVTDGRQVISAGVAAPVVVPVGTDSQDVIEVPLADDTTAVQDFVLERLDDSLDERLQIR